MGILADHQIAKEVKIEPFPSGEHRPGKISYGLSSYGMDVRAGYRFKIFTNVHCGIVDPKNFDPKSFVDVDVTPVFDHQWGDEITWKNANGTHTGRCCHICGCWSNAPAAKTTQCPRRNPDHILIPGNSFALAETIEYIEMPRDMQGIAIGKSTYARCGIIIPMTPIEAEWKGRITIEISNTTPLPAKIYAGEGIAQLLFFRGEQVCKVSYADKNGKYQNQTGLTLPIVK